MPSDSESTRPIHSSFQYPQAPANPGPTSTNPGPAPRNPGSAFTNPDSASQSPDPAPTPAGRGVSLHGRKPAIHWATLLLLSAIFVPLLEWAHLPAALLLGPMSAAILISALEGTVKIPSPLFIAAQSVIGCMIGRSLELSMLTEVVHHWPLFLVAVISVIAVSIGLSWLLMRWRVLPGTTAIWGSFPGAALVMVLMAEAYGEDVRLVAFMQYLRVVLVAITASLVSRLGSVSAGHAAAVIWFPSIAWVPFLETLAVAAVGALLGTRFRIPAGALLLPLFLGAALQDVGWLTIELPPWLLAISYAIAGWTIGLRFTRALLAHVARALPRVFVSMVSLIAICAGLGYALVRLAGIDPLTAYLATSPGGADSVAIIASGSPVNMPFVMSMQTARFVLVLIAGPTLARFMASRAGKRPPTKHRPTEIQ